MEEVQEPVSPQKRKRRPSVRLGEIGYSAPYLKASFLLEPAKRKKQQQVVESGVSPVKAPRTRLLDHVAVERKQQRDERWSPLEAADTMQQQSADEEEIKTEAVLASTSGRGDVEPGLKLGIAGRKVKQMRRKRAAPGGSGMGLGTRFGVADHSAGKLERREEGFVNLGGAAGATAGDVNDTANPKIDGALPVDEHETSFAKTSSSSLELYGDGGKVAADSRDPATTSAEEEQGDAHHPNSHGDEIQGAIEDGPMRNNRSDKQRTVAKQDLEQNLGTRQRGGDSDMAGENGAHLLPAAKPTIRQCITLTSGVRGWLRVLDLARYAEIFELHEVDNEVLPLLTMEDLREMGVNAVGARRKMFTAIQDLHHSYGT
ncbi:hypothetical protein CY35_11G066900 [Sphagnum magellanicum]|nr:hypothetical protein CY35_11G066900 [Sphagnum magellanicum]